MGIAFLEIAKSLGYVNVMFNLVFETNVVSIKLWEGLGFERIGTLPNAAKLKGCDDYVNAFMYYKSLV